MRKIRSDALWHKLTAEQQAKIQDWFFVQNLTYRAVHARMRDELGIRCALSIMGPMYHRCKEMRSQEREAILDRLTQVLTEPGAKLQRVPADSLTIIAGRLLYRALGKENTREVAALGRVLHQGETNEIQRDRIQIEKDKLAWQRAMLPATGPASVTREHHPLLTRPKAGSEAGKGE